jgi:hypothetical protein
MRDSIWFHGLLVTGAILASWAITGQESVPWTYSVLNVMLGGREIAQLIAGVGSIGDLLSGLLLPLPVLVLSIKL